MATTLQTLDKILRRAQAILHARLNFIMNVHRDYDSQFANSGTEGKIGATLRIRLPEQYAVTTGSTFVPQAITQNSVALTVATQKHVGLKLSSADMALSDEDFDERHLQPAMSTLATSMEADAMNMVLQIPYCVNQAAGAPATMLPFGQARAMMNKTLAPDAGKRSCLMDSDTSATMADGLKALFNDRQELSHAYLEGFLTRGQGFTFFENDLLPTLTTGTRSTSDTCLVAVAPVQGATSITVSGLTGSATIKKGEILTMQGMYMLHPESKTAFKAGTSPLLQPFVVTEDAIMSGGAGVIKIYPAINFNVDGFQNVPSQPVASSTIVYFAAASGGSGAASTGYRQQIAFHKDAFAFVTADLPLYPDQKMARKVMDKLSMRIWSFADGINDAWNTRVDVLYGYNMIRPLACRISY